MPYGSNFGNIDISTILESPKFVPNREYERLVAQAKCVVDGKLIGTHYPAGYFSIFDGYTTRIGGTTIGLPQIVWTDGTRLYAPTSITQTKVTFTGSSGASGTFTVGEIVAETGSGATGWLLSSDGSTVVVHKKTGTFNGAAVLTGASSAATITGGTAATASATFLTVADTPSSNAYSVMEIHNNIFANSFVDCGTVSGKHTLLLFMALPGYFPAIVAIYPDDEGPNAPVVLINCGGTGTAITHWHGGAFIGDADGVHHLVGYSGDTVHCSSVLICDDVADFVENPNTWKTRWGLDVTGTTRSALLNAEGYQYAVGTLAKPDTPALKPLSMVPNATGTKAYYITDNPDIGVKTQCVEIDLVNKSARLVSDEIVGIGGNGIRTSTGHILLTSGSEYTVGGDANSFSDGYYRLYVVNENGSGIRELYRWLRKDMVGGGLPASGPCYIQTIAEYPADSDYVSTIFLNQLAGVNTWYGGILAGQLTSIDSDYQQNTSLQLPESVPFINLVTNGNGSQVCGVLKDDGSGIPQYQCSAWKMTKCTTERDLSVVDTNRGGKTSIKITPLTASGEANISYTVGPAYLLLCSRIITYSMRVKLAVANADLYIAITNGISGAYSTYILDKNSTEWQTFRGTLLCPSNATLLSLTVTVRASGAATTNIVYLSDVVICPGLWEDKLASRNIGRDDLLDLPNVVQRGFHEHNFDWMGTTVASPENHSRVIRCVGAYSGNKTLAITQFPGAMWLFINATDKTVTVNSIAVATGKSQKLWSNGTTTYADGAEY